MTSAASDPELSFTIISCFISPNANPTVASDYTLIEMVCPKDDSVKFYPQRDTPFSQTTLEKKSFAFTFNSKFNVSLVFLHCEMSLCSKTSQTNSNLPPVCSGHSSILFYCFEYFSLQAIKVLVIFGASSLIWREKKCSIILSKTLSFSPLKLETHSAYSPMTPVIPFP